MTHLWITFITYFFSGFLWSCCCYCNSITWTGSCYCSLTWTALSCRETRSDERPWRGEAAMAHLQQPSKSQHTTINLVLVKLFNLIPCFEGLVGGRIEVLFNGFSQCKVGKSFMAYFNLFFSDLFYFLVFLVPAFALCYLFFWRKLTGCWLHWPSAAGSCGQLIFIFLPFEGIS